MLNLDEPGSKTTCAISVPWMEKGGEDRGVNKEERWGGRGGQPLPTLGLEVITVLCTQNNWSHQCGCHMESLALPRHRCSPFSGQNPPIKPKPVAKRPLAATPLHPSYPPLGRELQRLRSSQKLGPLSRENKGGRGVAASPVFLQIQSSSVWPRLETT